MSTYLSRLNPAERRFVVGVGLLFFVVINLVWVRPYFSDWSKLKKRSDAAYTKAQRYEEVIQKAPAIEKLIKELESENAYVPPEDQAIQFLRTIQVQTSQNGVQFISSGRQSTSTNSPFFLELTQTVSVGSNEKQMVDFLFSLGSGNSLIRVREISVRPDQNRQALNANITFVASYQKKRPTAVAPATTPAAKPAAPPVTSKPTVPAPPVTKPTPSKAPTPIKK